uniref:Uncharacterized protein n=1 Tax=Parastrongyloides trichosuri TaxID=131310 RepID=A0A0N4ZYQ4_PARTI
MLPNQHRQMIMPQQQQNYMPQNFQPKFINKVHQTSLNQRRHIMQQKNSYRNILQRSLISQQHPQVLNRMNKYGFSLEQNRHAYDIHGTTMHGGTKRFLTKPGQPDVYQSQHMHRRISSISNMPQKPIRPPPYASHLQKIVEGTKFKKAKKLRVSKNARILSWTSFIDPYFKGYETSTSYDSDEFDSEEEKEISCKYYARKPGPTVELPVERTESPDIPRQMTYL